MLSGIFDDDFGLSDGESSEEEGEDVYAYSGKHNLARREVAALSKAVSSEPTEDHNDHGEFSAMGTVPSASYDSVQEGMHTLQAHTERNTTFDTQRQ